MTVLCNFPYQISPWIIGPLLGLYSYVHITQLKMDPFCQGVNIFVGRTGQDICLVTAMLPYLVVRGSQPGHCLYLQMVGLSLDRPSAQPWCYPHWNAHRQEYIFYPQFWDWGGFLSNRCRHSKCPSDDAGKVKSESYKHYVRASPDELAMLSIRLAPGRRSSNI